MKKQVFLFLFILFGIKSFAQENTPKIEEYFELSLEEVLNVGIVSATQQEESVLDAPATAYVVTKNDIELRGYSDLVQLLEDIPEIEIQKNSNNEYKNIITVRGVTGNEKLVILRNGIRISPALGENYTLGSQFNIKDAERVEVIIGPASALYGADAFSGVVNIVYPEAPTNQKTDASISTSYGNFNSTTNNFYIGHKFDKLFLTVNGHYTYSDGANIDEVYTDDFKWYNDQFVKNNHVYESPYFLEVYDVYFFENAAGGSFTGKPISKDFYNGYESNSIQVNLHNEKFNIGYSRIEERHSSAIGQDPRFSIYDANAFVGTTQNNLTGKYNFLSFNQKWGLTSTFNFSDYELNPNSNWVNSSSRYQRGYYYSFTQSTKFDQKFNYNFNERTKLILGVSGEYASSLPKTSLSPTTYDPNLPAELQDYYYIGAAGYQPYAQIGESNEFNDSLTAQQTVYQVNYTNTAAYGQFQFRLLQSLNTTLGLRYDNNSRYGKTINPRAGIVFEPINKLKWKILYGESYLSPSPSKSFSQYGAFWGNSGDNLQADFFHVSNPDLKPEKLRSAETSINWFVNKNFSISADGFYTVVEDIINQFAKTDSSNNQSNISASQFETSLNEGNAIIMGGSLISKYFIKKENSQTTIYGSYSYIDGNLNDESLNYTAKHTAKFGVDFTYKRVGISLRGIYRSPSQSDIKLQGTNIGLQNPSYYVLNSNVSWKPLKKYNAKIFVSVENLTNKKYYNVYYGNEEGFFKTPQDPMRILIGFKYAL